MSDVERSLPDSLGSVETTSVDRSSPRWKGGATTSLERPLPMRAPDLVRTPAAIVELIRALATEQTDAQIARTLNARWLRTGRKQAFTRLIVRHIRSSYGISSNAQHLRQQGWPTVPEIAAQMKVHTSTAKSFVRKGVVRGRYLRTMMECAAACSFLNSQPRVALLLYRLPECRDRPLCHLIARLQTWQVLMLVLHTGLQFQPVDRRWFNW